MSDLSSVRTSRLDSPRCGLYAAASYASTAKSKASTLTQNASKLSSLTRSAATATVISHLTTYLENLLTVDEYGFTDCLCRKCQKNLSFDEIMAFCMPTKKEPITEKEIKEALTSLNEQNIICLSCYADVIQKRVDKRRSHLQTPIKTQLPTIKRNSQPSSVASTARSARTNRSNLIQRKPPQAPASRAASVASNASNPHLFSKFKRITPVTQKSVSRSFMARSPNSTGMYRRRTKTPEMSESALSSYENIRVTKQFHKKRDELSNFANAMYAHGTYR